MTPDGAYWISYGSGSKLNHEPMVTVLELDGDVWKPLDAVPEAVFLGLCALLANHDVHQVREYSKDCPRCNNKVTYFEEYDRAGCLDCDFWTEGACSCRREGHECSFPEAPAKPSQVIKLV